ncbi:MAG: SAM-dependent methyltransferase [Anaerolineae bacterium]|nr:SAM-dependent methyltransferase [Anaerolineae bacterium]
MEIRLTPIGHVRNAHPPGERPVTWQGIVSEIVLDPHWTEALSGLDGFSHAAVICYLHLSADRVSPQHIRAQGRPQMPLVGFFGTRTPARPNPLSLTVVEIVGREENVLTVRNLDMYDGTAVLDIKPYLTRGDCIPEATEPAWIHRLREIHDAERSS